MDASEQLQQVNSLADDGRDIAEISEIMQKSERWVKASLLIMRKLPPKVHKAIADRLFSRTTALQLLVVPLDKLDAVVDAAIKLAETVGKL